MGARLQLPMIRNDCRHHQRPGGSGKRLKEECHLLEAGAILASFPASHKRILFRENFPNHVARTSATVTIPRNVIRREPMTWAGAPPMPSQAGRHAADDSDEKQHNFAHCEHRARGSRRALCSDAHKSLKSFQSIHFVQISAVRVSCARDPQVAVDCLYFKDSSAAERSCHERFST